MRFRKKEYEFRFEHVDFWSSEYMGMDDNAQRQETEEN